MNRAVTQTRTGETWKHFKANYLMLVCGLTLAAGAAVAISEDSKVRLVHPNPHPSTTTGRALHEAPRGNLPKWISNQSSQPQVAFYLISTEAEETQVLLNEGLAESVRFGMGVPEPRRSVVILQAGSAEEELQAKTIIEAAMAASNFVSDAETPVFQVVDMRSR